jgi:signal transduction histidine kinase
MVDPRRVAQALDNLIANAIEHGGLRVLVEATIAARGVRISVSNAALPAPARAGSDPRRGHGLRLVASIAAASGGRFLVQHRAGAWVAVLELPLAPRPADLAA